MKTLATCLLLIYVSVSCRPVLPVLADGLAHLLWYQQHVETVHMHDGYAHVHQEIADVAAEDFGEQGTAPSQAKSFKISDFVAAHVVAEIPTFNISFSDIQSAILPGSACVLVDLYSKKVPVPPPDTDRLTPHKPYITLLLAGTSTIAPDNRTVYGRCWRPRQQQDRTAPETTSQNQILSPYYLLFKEIEREVGVVHLTPRLSLLTSNTSHTFFFFTYHFTVTV